MANLATLRDQIQSALPATLTAYDVATGKERLQAGVVAIVFPVPPSGLHETDNSGGEQWRFAVELHTSYGGANGLIRAQDKIDGFISTSGDDSIYAALNDNDGSALGGNANFVRVEPFTVYGFAQLNGIDTLMTRIPVFVQV